jgi:hypothetical protein
VIYPKYTSCVASLLALLPMMLAAQRVQESVPLMNWASPPALATQPGREKSQQWIAATDTPYCTATGRAHFRSYDTLPLG